MSFIFALAISFWEPGEGTVAVLDPQTSCLYVDVTVFCPNAIVASSKSRFWKPASANTIPAVVIVSEDPVTGLTAVLTNPTPVFVCAAVVPSLVAAASLSVFKPKPLKLI